VPASGPTDDALARAAALLEQARQEVDPARAAELVAGARALLGG